MNQYLPEDQNALIDMNDLKAAAKQIIIDHKRPSISLVQRHLKCRYNLAARLLEDLAADGFLEASGAFWKIKEPSQTA